MKAGRLRGGYGPWALVTGASSGIGTEFSRQVAAEGLNVILVARREQLLDELASELRRDHGVEVVTLALDLTSSDAGAAVESRVKSLDLGLVILNAGAALPGAFLRQPIEDRLRNVVLNVTGPAELAYRLGGRLVERGGGGLLLVSSVVGHTGSPYMASYAASKSFLLQFGRALAVEWRGHGVDVLVLAPGATRTPMTNVEELDMTALPMPWMEPERVARIGLRSLGQKSTVIPGKRNRLMISTMKLMPDSMTNAMFGSMMRRATADALR